jgi:group II intron reverse transcriptase/maturase
MKKVNWVLDADIRCFFDTIKHDWLMKMIGHRIADKRVLRLIQKWLTAGVLEEGKITESELGTVQGGSISPLLANIYLHYVFDLWVQQWRKKQASGEIIVVRFADDFIVGFQHRKEAEQFLEELKARFAKFGLELQLEKTRMIEFGRYAARDRKQRGDGKPDTFNFLGFTHICGTTSKGRYTVVRHTMRKKWQAKLTELNIELRRRLHDSIAEQGAYLRAVIMGHVRYYGVPFNSRALGAFRMAVGLTWWQQLKRRSQRNKVTVARMKRWTDRWFPPARICHPYPYKRLCVRT